MKKLSFLTSMVALTFAVPAMAVPSNTSSTFPSNGVMEEDYTYQNQANVTNLKVSSGTATTTAQYDNCPVEYPNSDAGATSTDECYKSCALAPHAATMTGKDYSGANVTDTCAIASCNTGYTTNFNLFDLFPDGTTVTSWAIRVPTTGSIDGNASLLTSNAENGEFVYLYENGTRIHGFLKCSSDGGTPLTEGTPTIKPSLSNTDTTSGNCWVKLDGIGTNGTSMSNLDGSWILFRSGYDYDCATIIDECMAITDDLLRNDFTFFNNSFSSQCNATMYTVGLNANNWNATAGTESVIATYDTAMPSITLPTMAGNVFAGYYDTNATTGGTQYYTATGVSAHIWDKTTADPTLYARWTECSAGSYCPGDNTTQSCPNDYPSSVAGASANTQCYKSCSASSFANAATVTGNDYYGANSIDTCVITACNTGYTPTPDINLSEIIGDTSPDNIVFKTLYGDVIGNPSVYNVTQNGEFAFEYSDNKGTIHGAFQCSSLGGNGALEGNPAAASVAANLPDNVGGNCWCKVDGYIPNGGTMQNLNGQWVLGVGLTDGFGGNPEGCLYECQNVCSDIFTHPEVRNKAFGVTHVAPACEANIIQITWADAAQSDIDANEAGQCTYGGDIRTPKKAVHKPGKIFTGWTFNTPSGN